MVIGGDNLPSPVQIGLTDLQDIGGASGPPGPPVPAPLLLQPGGQIMPTTFMLAHPDLKTKRHLCIVLWMYTFGVFMYDLWGEL